MQKSRILLFNSTVFPLFLTFISGQVYGVDLTLSVANQKSNLGYNSSVTQTYSGSLSFYVSDYARISYTYSQQHNDDFGYRVAETADSSTVTDDDYYQSKIRMTSHAFDLALILYNGDVMAPYIFGGGIWKNYNIYTEYAGYTASANPKLGPDPHGGIGLGIRLNRDFSLKLTYTLSLGIQQLPDEEPRSVWDTSTSVGITYRL